MTDPRVSNVAPSAFRKVPRTGVIYVMNEAARHGYTPGDPGWTNFGQGQPQTDAIPGAPPRVHEISITDDDHEYAPVPGVWELREAVADHYNRRYRKGMASQYTAENVCICSGGRTALTRIAAALGDIHLGHFLPDYTAYEELLGIFKMVSPIPILLDPDRGYDFSLESLRQEVQGRGLSALLVSNPCNPTGKVLQGETLAGWVSMARQLDCTLIMDEFYSHYIWKGDEGDANPTVTSARFVEDVEKDPVLIVNGLTKNWRYPGWRVAWTLGPREVISRLASAGSFLDGGGCRPMQRAAIPLLSDAHTDAEIKAVQKHFGAKRSMMLSRLSALNIWVERPPAGTFYVWGNISQLPEPLNIDMNFFKLALKRQVICVPGSFFDVNPGRKRAARPSRFRHHIRFSFGPDSALLRGGLDRLEALIDDAAHGRITADDLRDP
jgi:N-succinyldiaminopimelate aminotransferase